MTKSNPILLVPPWIIRFSKLTQQGWSDLKSFSFFRKIFFFSACIEISFWIKLFNSKHFVNFCLKLKISPAFLYHRLSIGILISSKTRQKNEVFLKPFFKVVLKFQIFIILAQNCENLPQIVWLGPVAKFFLPRLSDSQQLLDSPPKSIINYYEYNI